MCYSSYVMEVITREVKNIPILTAAAVGYALPCGKNGCITRYTGVFAK